MNLTRRSLLTLGGAAALSACKRTRTEEKPPEKPAREPEPPQEEVPEEPQVDLNEFEELAIDMRAWSYDEVGDCYYQLGLPYVLNPGSAQYGSLAIFVPGAYFTAKKHGRHYTCELAEGVQIGAYTPSSAPIALPINVRSFGAQECPETYAYEGLDRYLSQGLVYVYVGLRGRSGGYESTTQEYFSGGAPWPVADLKAAVRWLRYNASVLPGDPSRIFAFGMGSGGGLAATLGASGNASDYLPYLTELGAATHDAQGTDLTDDIAGVATWCPIVSLGVADAAYEWMMGQYVLEGARAEGTWTSLLSDDLAAAYGSYVNDLGLVDSEGASLTLDRIEDGSFGGGSYYDYLVGTVADAAAHFLKRTEFPYTELPRTRTTRVFPGNPSLDVSGAGDASAETDEDEASASGVRQVQATVYDTLGSYVSSLNGTNRWLTYNASRGAVDVTGLWEFASSCRPATERFCAYDLVDRSGYANQLFGTAEQTSLHFDGLAAGLVESKSGAYAKGEGWDDGLVAAWRGDLAETDELDVTVAERVRMMDPMRYLLPDDEDVAGAADEEDPQATAKTVAAAHWRINTGLFQSRTTLADEVNLSLALAAREDVADVSFEAVWGAGFVFAERSGDPEDNLVSWICSCCPPKDEEPASDDASTSAAESEPEEENS